MRDRYEEIQGRGAELVAIGTGNPDLARWLVEDYDLAYPVLLDADAAAAKAASIERVGPLRLFHPASFGATIRAWRAGHRVGLTPTKRIDQLGATFVVAPGGALRYEHRDAHPADHAPLGDVLAALA